MRLWVVCQNRWVLEEVGNLSPSCCSSKTSSAAPREAARASSSCARCWCGDYADPGRANVAIRHNDACPPVPVEVVGPLLRTLAAASLHGGTVVAEPLAPFLHGLRVDGHCECVSARSAQLDDWACSQQLRDWDG